MAPFLTSFVFCQRLEIFSVISTVFYSVFNAWMWCDACSRDTPRHYISITSCVSLPSQHLTYLHTHIYLFLFAVAYFQVLRSFYLLCLLIYGCILRDLYTFTGSWSFCTLFCARLCAVWFVDRFLWSALYTCWILDSVHTHVQVFIILYRTDHCIYQVLIKCVRIY